MSNSTNDKDEPIIWHKVAPPPTDEIAEHEAKMRAPKAQRWMAAVRETMDAWDISEEEAEAIVRELHWAARDAASLRAAKAEMPKWQAQIERVAWQVAEMLLLGVLSPIAVRRLREGLAEYDAQAKAQEAKGKGKGNSG